MADDLRVKFWGVRGSYPTPGPGTVKYGGNTACVEIRIGERTIVLDAGTGIIPLGRELARRTLPPKSCCCSATCIMITHRAFPFSSRLICRMQSFISLGRMARTSRCENVLEHNQSSETFPVSLRDMASSKEYPIGARVPGHRLG